MKLGAPDPTRDTHAPYKGAWATFESKCPVCYGTGKERYKHNSVARVRIHFDIDGNVLSRSAVADPSPYKKGNQ